MKNRRALFGFVLGVVAGVTAYWFIAPTAGFGTSESVVSSPARAPALDARASPASHSLVRSNHFVYGMPEAVDDRYDFTPPSGNEVAPGILVLAREGFWLGVSGRFKAPLWMCQRWTSDDLQRSEEAGKSPRRNYKMDEELPTYARAPPDFDYPETHLDCGHMAPHAANFAWGEDAAETGNLTSNIVPQRDTLNRKVWKYLEDAHRRIVAAEDFGSDTVWIIAGAVYRNGAAESTLANGVGVPYATYKIISWYGKDGGLTARGYLMPQDAQGSDPARFLVSVDAIEAMTGLDFFSEMVDAEENAKEAAVPSAMWN